MKGARSVVRHVWMVLLIHVPGLFSSALGGQTVYFPQYADGEGFSMQITILNSSATPSQAALRIFDFAGMPQELPGIGSDLNLELGPNQTMVLTSDGSSNPVKTGYMELESESAEVSGLAIFKLADGRETTVPPTWTGNRFALYIERAELSIRAWPCFEAILDWK